MALVGESGSGKSTTAAAVNRLLPPNGRVTGGEIGLDGRDCSTLGEREMRRIRGAGIGLVPQDPMSNLDPLMRIGDQVAEALEVHDVATGKAAWARAVELLELVGIPDPPAARGTVPARVLRRDAPARAHRRWGWPADHGCSSPTSRRRRSTSRCSAASSTPSTRITDEIGTQVLLITHDLGLAAERADTVAVMYRGEIVETGPADTHPRRARTRIHETGCSPPRRASTPFVDGPADTAGLRSPPSRWCGSRASASGSRYAGAAAARATTSWPSTTCRSTSRAGRPWRSSASPVRGSRPPRTSCWGWRRRRAGASSSGTRTSRRCRGGRRSRCGGGSSRCSRTRMRRSTRATPSSGRSPSR